MAYIFPDSTIYLYNNIELDNSYKDTLYFSDINQQNQYFTVTKPYKYAFLMQMYQRTNKGTLRIEKNAEALYDCNYLRFKNPRTINNTIYDKWYYAFITDWEYINENVTEITYEIDIMQTYFFDVIVEPSFVVRQMPLTDNKYENLIEESLNFGTDYVVSDGTHTKKLDLDSIMVLSSKAGFDSGAAGVDVGHPIPTLINNVITPLAVATFIPVGSETLLDVHTKMVRHFKATAGGGTTYRESIIAVYIIPQEIANLVPSGATMPDSTLDSLSPVIEGPSPQPEVVANIGGADILFGTYAPHNYKLYNYPYSFLNVSNHQGDSVDYKYELFTSPDSPAFEMNIAAIPSPSVMFSPRNYRKLVVDYDSSLNITEFPTTPVNIDGYQQWLTHNAGKMTAQALTAGLMLTAGITSFALTPVIGQMGGNLLAGAGGLFEPEVQPLINADKFRHTSLLSQAGALRRIGKGGYELSSFASNVAKIFGEVSDAKKLPNGVKGNLSGSPMLQGLDLYEFHFYKMQIKEQEARKIDTFFDMFGYKMNQVMNVNRSSRPVYNYVKTEGCCIIPNQQGNSSNGANARVISEMQKIYDNGITFWKPNSGYNIGDYSWNCRDANSLHPQNVTP